ncbi:hypothetical protein DAEQUDRAFT_729736 [Daedalea quercina L-15889]|uniref:C2H2-type domain-containing protein n=1 Tax=Daedalea quercina L-15889 TaxID=1314783 RepID=A0A165NGG6_9APHY|nr:hypothetical protein DAEQUDRAFT_729736 [Daedalea quercina L-15889]
MDSGADEAMHSNMDGRHILYTGHQLSPPVFSEDSGPSLFIAPGPPQAVTVPLLDLEAFRNDIYSSVGYEHAPIAEAILELLRMYTKVKAEGRLHSTPSPILRPLSHSSSPEPGYDISHPEANHDDATGLVLCRWRGCRERIGSTNHDVREHVLANHLADISVPGEDWRSSNSKVPCRWIECDVRLLARSVPKHICGAHLKATVFVCPVEGCDEKLSRADALRRHIQKKHG